MKRAGRQRIIIKTVPKEEVIKPSVPTAIKIRVEETVESLLRQIEDELPKIPNVISRLVSMEDNQGKPVLSIRNRENIFSVIGMLQFMELDALEAYFSSIKFNEQAIWDSPIFNKERSKEHLDADIFLNRIRIKKGLVQCTRCPSKDVLYYDLQTRGSDEPPTFFFICLQCGKKWNTS